MKIAVMQPYVFPYLGYFQLLHAADRFALFDDVHFIMRGWINRNRILMNGDPHLFTIPLRQASQNRLIHDIQIAAVPWHNKFLSTLRHAYRSAPHFAEVFDLVRSVVERPAHTIDELAYESLISVVDYLGIHTTLIRSTRQYDNRHLPAQERIIDICVQEGADMYINASGGRALYTIQSFRARGIDLRFLEPIPLQYRQFSNAYVPSLSIIDVLMFNDPAAARRLLLNYRLEE
jgi:hypothetical protein